MRSDREPAGRITLRTGKFSRRDLLTASAALAVGAVFAAPASAARPAPSPVGPALVDAARREGKLALYSALDLPLSEKLARTFETKYPGIAVRVERSGAERVFQRIGQELASRILSVDVAISTDAAHFVAWKRSGWLAPYLPEEVAQHYRPDDFDADGMYATMCGSLSGIGYNTKLVKREDAPASFADLLDPKWRGRLVKAHPAYSGTILTATYALSHELGWPYLEKLAAQKVMQVQSAGDPPKKLALGERAVQVDGVDAILLQLKEQGQPVEFIYASEGTPFITTPSGVFASAPNPNAARLFYSFLCGADGQQVFVEAYRHSPHPLVKAKPGRPPLTGIKLMRSDPVAVEVQSEEIKARYAKVFGV
jgi:iron(III) transport system substrate-binding protein